MKTNLVIGLGNFGRHLCENLISLGNEVMAVDTDEACVNAVAPFVTAAQIGDCTSTEVLETLGVRNYDTCFVCIGEDFQNSLEVTSLLKEMGAKYVVSKAIREVQEKFLLRNGADEVIFPERDISEKISMRFSSSNIFNYLELSKDISIYEIPVMDKWIGKSIGQIDIRKTYNVNIIATKRGDETLLTPGPSHVFCEGEHIMVIGTDPDINRILRRI